MVNIEFVRSSEIVTLSTNNLKAAKTALWHFKPNWGIIRIDMCVCQGSTVANRINVNYVNCFSIATTFLRII